MLGWICKTKQSETRNQTRKKCSVNTGYFLIVLRVLQSVKDSAILRHLLITPKCAARYSEDSFTLQFRVRYAQHLSILQAIILNCSRNDHIVHADWGYCLLSRYFRRYVNDFFFSLHSLGTLRIGTSASILFSQSVFINKFAFQSWFPFSPFYFFLTVRKLILVI